MKKHNWTFKQWYNLWYLKSKKWGFLKRRAIKTHGAQCAKCQSTTPPLDVHHLNYRNIFDVTVDDLQVLCRDCHTKEHDNKLRDTP
jgi:5-methylcytosine-specific restriction endonuclease McrA